jgi:predicted GNAT family N-acyltransferase
MHREIRAQLFDRLPADALDLRAVSFPAADGTLVGSDEFDARSLHIVFREDSRIAAYGRLTIGAPGVFRTWSRGAAVLPDGFDVADLGRCCVHPDYRRLELLRAVCVEALIYASEHQIAHANGAYKPGRHLAAMLHEIGYSDCGLPVEEFEPNGNIVTIQPVTCNLRSTIHRWLAQQRLVSEHLAAQGFSLRVDLGSASGH